MHTVLQAKRQKYVYEFELRQRIRDNLIKGFQHQVTACNGPLRRGEVRMP